jgi:4-hydroxythreonine-4-phosphate dehydrogenase
MKNAPLIAISIGDPNGIGPEVVCRALGNTDVWTDSTPVIYAHRALIHQTLEVLSAEQFPLHVITSTVEAVRDKINLVEAWSSPFNTQSGKASLAAGACALASLEQATNDLIGKQVDALVTAPIDKHSIQSDQFTFPGHTEYLAMRDNASTALMFLVTDKLRVGVVTGHIPVSKIARHITSALIIEKLQMMQASLIRDFGIADPKIAVLGLNPHAGDEGLIGCEEQTIIAPALEKAKQMGLGAHGPFPAEGFFGSRTYECFDAVLAMYHDQGLVPFKALSFGGGVNFTAGLSIVRTSPDHGTAYNIAGQGIADERSFIAAYRAALAIVKQRGYQGSKIASN